MNQKQVWNSIAQPWKQFRTKPILEVVEFLKAQEIKFLGSKKSREDFSGNKKGKILDLGCGSGRNFIKIKETIYGVDFSKKMLKLAEQSAKKNKIKAKFFEAEADKLPFKNNFFNAAIFIATLHCIETSEKRENSLKELLRVLKPKSEALITAWDKNQESFKNKPKENYFSWKHNNKKFMRYYYLYEKDELMKMLKKVGFEIIKVNNINELSGNYSKRNILVVVRKN